MPLTDAQWARIGPLLPDRRPERALVLTAGRAGDAPAFIDGMVRLRVPDAEAADHRPSIVTPASSATPSSVPVIP
ncbi:hypothetical protein ADL35_37765 [Streptomyces sp. NRRL WC-3753]|nr:hypothetical protein ADL35_37765 [Streptomyces sp. NRRL WC-3753]